MTYLHRDHLSSTRTMTNAAGARAAGQVYVPFGELVQIGAPLATAETKGFIGERYDSDAGLQYLNARYYDPKLGIFLQPDWFEVTKAGVGTNRYSYSFNDPVNARDPEGNFVVGALFGAMLSVGVDVAIASINGQSLSIKEIGLSAAKGAVAGLVGAGLGSIVSRGVAAATGKAIDGAIVGGAVGGAAAGAVASVEDQVVELDSNGNLSLSSDIDPVQTVNDAAKGALIGGPAGALQPSSKVVGALGAGVKDSVKSLLGDIAEWFTGEAGEAVLETIENQPKDDDKGNLDGSGGS